MNFGQQAHLFGLLFLLLYFPMAQPRLKGACCIPIEYVRLYPLTKSVGKKKSLHECCQHFCSGCTFI